MRTTAAAAVDRLRAAGWTTTEPDSSAGGAVPALDGFPHGVRLWAGSFATLVSPDETAWFLSAADYAGTTDSAFAWDEFERMSLEAATGPEQEAEVRGFWSRHLPVLLSVRDGYAYLAVRDDGVVVFGEEPEFEEAEAVATSFSEFLDVVGRPGATTRFPPPVAALLEA